MLTQIKNFNRKNCKWFYKHCLRVINSLSLLSLVQRTDCAMGDRTFLIPLVPVSALTLTLPFWVLSRGFGGRRTGHIWIRTQKNRRPSSSTIPLSWRPSPSPDLALSGWRTIGPTSTRSGLGRWVGVYRTISCRISVRGRPKNSVPRLSHTNSLHPLTSPTCVLVVESQGRKGHPRSLRLLDRTVQGPTVTDKVPYLSQRDSRVRLDTRSRESGVVWGVVTSLSPFKSFQQCLFS